MASQSSPSCCPARTDRSARAPPVSGRCAGDRAHRAPAPPPGAPPRPGGRRGRSGAAPPRTGGPKVAYWAGCGRPFDHLGTPRAPSLRGSLAHTGGRRDPAGARTPPRPSPRAQRPAFSPARACTGSPRAPRACGGPAAAAGGAPHRGAPAPHPGDERIRAGRGPASGRVTSGVHRSEPVDRCRAAAGVKGRSPDVAGRGRCSAPRSKPWSDGPLTPTALRHGPPAIEAMASRTEHQPSPPEPHRLADTRRTP
jgi:hypothetical protein